MNSDRRVAVLVGALYITGTVSGALSLVVTDPILSGPDYLAQLATHHEQMAAGVLLLLTMCFSLALVPIVFWPVGCRYHETLAMGYVVFRGGLESVTYIVGALGWLVLLALAGQSDAGPMAGFVRTMETTLWNEVIAIPFVLGAAMFYYLLFESRLVPGWVSVWGLVGAALYIVAPIARMFGQSIDFMMAPLGVQEMVMAAWLIAKGFARVPVATARTQLRGGHQALLMAAQD